MHFSSRRMRAGAARRGVALVIVLSFLVIISVLVIAFFTRVATELQASRSYAAGVTARQLAESATSVVMGQIREATVRFGGAWASQPGMIRVYGDGSGASEKADAFFKLYSSENMTVTQPQIGTFDPAADVPVSGAGAWHRNPSLFTDLNEPVNVVLPGTKATAKSYPIMDPSAVGTVEGFGISVDGADPQGAARLARMPVRWIYVLQDGTLSAPKSADATGLVANWAGTSPAGKTPAKDNPIVGRIAFWTDDESCKVNINTAGGFSLKDLGAYKEETYAGSFWDTPRTLTEFDYGKLDASGELLPNGGSLSLCQPVRNEFQRYPGHPATTSLGLVFGSLLTSEQLYQLTPRLNIGGSQGGTERLLAATDEPLKTVYRRLYASVDEMLYAPGMKAGVRETNDSVIGLTDPALKPDMLGRLRFFLTAHSRAPELNLYGRPRVTIWPVHTDPAIRNAPDDLIAFCSTIGPTNDQRQFLFQRKDAYHPTTDAEIPRNAKLYDYLREVTSQNVPGFGGSFEAKYKADRDQILTEIFDYIRCANMRDSTHDKEFNTFAEPKRTREKERYKFAPRGIVVPIHFSREGRENIGFGRFPTISEAALVLYHAGYVGNDDSVYLDRREKAKRGVKKNLVRAFMVFETFNPMQGYAPTQTPNGNSLEQRPIAFELEGLDAFQLGGKALGFPQKARNSFIHASGSLWGGRNSGGSEGFTHTLWGKWGKVPGKNWYEFQTTGDGIPIDAATKTVALKGAVLTLDIKFDTLPIRKLKLTFPDATVPVPTDEIFESDPGGFVPNPAKPDWACNLADIRKVKSFAGRLGTSAEQDGGTFAFGQNAGDSTKSTPPGLNHTRRDRQILQPGDTVRSLVFAGEGDLRVSALTDDGSVFQAHPKYGDSSVRQAQTLRRADSLSYFAGTTYGKIVKLPKGKNYPAGQAADLPDTVDGVVRTDGKPGDFDTGIGNLADGPFCGKADEGNLAWRYWDSYNEKWVYVHPYFTSRYEETFETFFTPNRQTPSAVVFGSLLAGRNAHWQTLCFSPNPAGAAHPGSGTTPKDHLLLDLFNMPVVEPYAISEPFSTAGKVNINYPIAPFSYITRSTGIRSALQSVRVSAFPAADVDTYKTKLIAGKNYRYPVDRDETIKAFDDYFAAYARGDHNKGFFKSASEICDRFLYPKGATNTGLVKWNTGETAIRNFWDNNTLTGDNVREKPYADIYPRLTTKSNTYTVHFRVQTLRQRPRAAGTDYAKWEEGRDTVLGEFRGSTTVERYVDPGDRRFDKSNPETVKQGDFIDVDAEPLEKAYRFRVVLNKKFAP